jgi:hypothetical protein
VATGGAHLVADAAVGFKYCELGVCVGATGGVYADLTLLTVTAPIKARLGWSLARLFGGVQIGYELKGDLSLRSLDGELGLFAEVDAIVYDHRWEHELIEWNGFSASYSLFNAHGTHCLVGTCFPVIADSPIVASR